MRKSNCVYAYTSVQNTRAVFAYAALFLITIVSVMYIVHESVHVCSGEDCPVCACIRSVKNNLSQLTIDLTETMPPVVPAFERIDAAKYFCASVFCRTLVEQKIKLNN